MIIGTLFIVTATKLAEETFKDARSCERDPLSMVRISSVAFDLPLRSGVSSVFVAPRLRADGQLVSIC